MICSSAKTLRNATVYSSATTSKNATVCSSVATSTNPTVSSVETSRNATVCSSVETSRNARGLPMRCYGFHTKHKCLQDKLCAEFSFSVCYLYAKTLSNI